MKIRLFALLALVSFPAPAEEGVPKLPNGHLLKKNETDQYSLENRNRVEIIGADILSVGHDNSWIVACVKNPMDLKRYVFINLGDGGSVDTINKENWEYFVGKFSSLSKIEMLQLGKEKCP